ncbi:hypothetical protein [Agromyces sp. SYSU T00266]|uniref:hypothetical protein n=1 Tax=Agromyces zhanjiangensis TaxID=3158562 RepID=UPI00339730B6
MELAAASTAGGLGTAVLPLVALAASVVAASAVGSLVVAWLQKPRGEPDASLVDVDSVGLLPVGFVSGSASNRWLPAKVVELAIAGTITIEDRRGADDRGDPEDAARSIRLVYAGDLPVSVAHPVDRDSGDLVLGVFGPGATGTTYVIAHGATVPVDRVVVRNGDLQRATRRRFEEAAERYRERRPATRFRVATVAGITGVVLGFVGQFVGHGADDSLAWTALGIGAAALALRAVLPRWIPLNADGLELRNRANLRRERLAAADLRDPAVAATELPWAVLFGQDEVVERAAASLARPGTEVGWYASPVPGTPDRLSSGLAALSAALAQPITLGGRDDGRFGVPLIDQYRMKTDFGYFGDGRAGGGLIYGDAAGAGPDGFGGFDGGFDGGGFDGGGGGDGS